MSDVLAEIRKFRPLLPIIALLIALCAGWIGTQEANADDGIDVSVARKISKQAIEKEVEIHNNLANRDTRILVLEGDSWFDLPLHTDVAGAMKKLGYAIISGSDAGDTLENMTYNGQLAKMAGQFRRIQKFDKYPHAILLSAGGNDLVGSNLAFIVNHKLSTIDEGLSVQNEILGGALERFQSTMSQYIAAISFVMCDFWKDSCRNIPIIVHGYDYPKASGDGFRVLWLFTMKGPWLKPSFDLKKYNENEASRIINDVVDKYNETLSDVAAKLHAAKKVESPVFYLNLRGTVEAGQWSDELHPNAAAMKKIACEFDTRISQFHNHQKKCS